MACPEIIASLRLPGDREPLEKMSAPVLLDGAGYAWIPDAHRSGAYQHREVCNGIAIAWAPVPEIERVLLCLAGGHPLDPSDEALTVLITRTGLREIIADLQSIDAQLDDMS